MKFPLSLTTGPAFALPMRSASVLPPAMAASGRVGEPSEASLSRTGAYANGTTSMGMPWCHCAPDRKHEVDERVSENKRRSEGHTLSPRVWLFLR